MSNLREAAQQALEALKTYVSAYNDYWERGMDILQPMGEGAISSLEAALAQPDDKAQPLYAAPQSPAVRIEPDGVACEDSLYYYPSHCVAADSWIRTTTDYFPVWRAPQPPAEQPFQPGWMNYKQGFVDGKAEAEQGVALSDDKEFLEWISDTLIELNPSNYGHDDVCRCSDASVEVILAIQKRLADRAARGGSA